MPAHRKYFNLPEFKTCPVCGRDFPRPVGYGHDRWFKAKLCSLSCASKAGNERKVERRQSLHDEFWRLVDKTPGQGPNGDCWEWRGSRWKNGYGRLGWKRGTLRVTHIALEIDGRPVRDGEMACHRCDNPPCVRPDHLFPAPGLVNVQDKVAKGRHIKGDAHKSSRLTDDDIRDIRADQRIAREIAPAYGISISNVQAIKSRRTWRHVE